MNNNNRLFLRLFSNKRIGNPERGKLNERGFTLMELFFSFLFIIAVSVLILNAFAKRDTVTDTIREIETDNFETMKAISKGLLFHGPDDRYSINLTGYVGVTDIDRPNEFHLVNVYQQGTHGMELRNFGRRYEVSSRYRTGETYIETQRDKLRNDYRVMVSVNKYSNGKFTSVKTPTLITTERGKVSAAGVYYTLPSDIYRERYKDYNFDNLIIPEDNIESGVDVFEETY